MPGESETRAFLFTDIARSSAGWEREPEAMARRIAAHNATVREAVERHGGEVFKSLGDGLAAVFSDAAEAVLAALAAQSALEPGIVRIGVHAGAARWMDGDWQGAAVNRTARIADLAHPGQVLVSATAYGLAADLVGSEIAWVGLGSARLAGHDRPEGLWQAAMPGAAAEFPRLPFEEPPHNLLGPERELVGRAREREELSGLLAGRKRRQATLLGFGGMGKTTLATAVAWDCLPDFPGGVWWAELETCRTEEQAAAVVASAVADGAAAPGGLAEAIGDARTLLVLDCCDGLGGRLGFVERLLRACPGLSVLAISRCVLGLPAEHIVELRGLDQCPGPDGLSDATRLLHQAVEDATGEPLPRTARKQAAALAKRLEGSPLAILLAAGRLRLMSFETLAGRVEESHLRSLRSSEAHGRHASLRHVVETSLELLDEEDREWTFKAAVFRGGFRLEDFLDVYGREEEVEDAVHRLRDRSLLSVEPGPHGLRFRQLDAVREFATEAADPALTRPWREAHARHYATVAASLAGLEASESARCLLAEGGNFTEGAGWAVEADDPSLVAAYAWALARPYAEVGLVHAFESLADAGHRAAVALGDTALRVELLGLQGIVARRAGALDRAKEAWQLRARLAEEAGREELLADTLGDLTTLAIELGEHSAAEELLGRIEAIAARSACADLEYSGPCLRARLAVARKDPAEASRTMRAVAEGPVNPLVAVVGIEAFLAGGEAELAEAWAIEFARQCLAARELPRLVVALSALAEAGNLLGKDAEPIRQILAAAPPSVARHGFANPAGKRDPLRIPGTVKVGTPEFLARAEALLTTWKAGHPSGAAD